MKTNNLYKFIDENNEDSFFYICTPQYLDDYIDKYPNNSDMTAMIEAMEKDGVEFFVIFPENCEEILTLSDE